MFVYFQVENWEMSRPELKSTLMVVDEVFGQPHIGILTFSGLKTLRDLEDFAHQHLQPIAPWLKTPRDVQPSNLQPDLA